MEFKGLQFPLFLTGSCCPFIFFKLIARRENENWAFVMWFNFSLYKGSLRCLVKR